MEKRLQLFLILFCGFSLLFNACGKRNRAEEREVSQAPSSEGGVSGEFDPSEDGEGYNVVGQDIPIEGEQDDMSRYFDPSPEDDLDDGSEDPYGDPDTEDYRGEARERQFVFRRVHFPFDSYRLTPQTRSTLQEIGEYLLNNPRIEVAIEGHCDERGSDSYNLALGEKRALSVREFLVAMGISADRLRTVSYGEESPLVRASNERAWAKNRRAEFRIAIE